MRTSLRGALCLCFLSFVACGTPSEGDEGTVVLLRRRPDAAKVQAGPGWPGLKGLTIAIAPLERQEDPEEPDLRGIAAGAAQDLRTMLEEQLVGTGAQIVSRADIDRLVKEHSLRFSDVRSGRLPKAFSERLQADALLVGQIKSFNAVPKAFGSQKVFTKVSKVEFTLYLVDVATGQILMSASHRGGGLGELSDEKVVMRVDRLNNDLQENDEQDKAHIADTPRLARMLVEQTIVRMKSLEALAPLPTRRRPVAGASPKRTAPVAPPTRRGDTYVLVVGVNAYADKQIPALRFAESDARRLYGFYADHDRSPTRRDRVQRLYGKQAKRTAVLKAVREHLAEKATRPEDTAVLYFAGHGFTDAKGTYLACHDTQLASLPETGISLAQLQSSWSQIKAGTKILIADACHAGGLVKSVRGLGGSVQVADEEIKGAARARGPVTINIAAASQNQLSTENEDVGAGVFTQTLVDGLKGSADSNGDKRVSASELKAYLAKEVPRRARSVGGRQTPVMLFPAGYEPFVLTR